MVYTYVKIRTFAKQAHRWLINNGMWLTPYFLKAKLLWDSDVSINLTIKYWAGIASTSKPNWKTATRSKGIIKSENERRKWVVSLQPSPFSVTNLVKKRNFVRCSNNNCLLLIKYLSRLGPHWVHEHDMVLTQEANIQLGHCNISCSFSSVHSWHAANVSYSETVMEITEMCL